MKKIISLILTVLILSSFATVGLAVDDYNVTYVIRDAEGNVIENLSDIAVSDEDYFMVDVMLDTIPTDLTVAVINVSYDDSIEFAMVDSQQATGKKMTTTTYWGPSLGAEAWTDGVVSGQAITYSGNKVSTGNYTFKTDVPLFTMFFYKKAESGTVNITMEKLNLAHESGTNYYAVGKPSVSLALGESAPAVEWIPVSASVVELTGDDPEAVDYAYGINTTCPGAVQMMFAADVDGARKYSQAFSAEGTEGSVNYGFYAGTTQYGNVSVLFRDAAEKEDTTKIWYSNALDLANKE